MKGFFSITLSVTCVCVACHAQQYARFIPSNYTLANESWVFNYDGSRLQGPRYLVMIYGGSTPDSLAPVLTEARVPLAPIPFLTGSIGAGHFHREGFVLAPLSDHPDSKSWIQVRAWDSYLGGTYEEAAAKGVGGFGSSEMFLQFGFPENQGPSQVLSQLHSFSISAVVPEPESWALLGTGLALLGWQAWRRRQAPAMSAGPTLTARGSRDTSP